jgi:predicted XRE-type DNA-binding protein
MDQELKRQLARELRAIMDGWSQVGAAGMLDLRQQDVSRLWHGNLAGFSVGRLLRLIAERHYHVEIHLRTIPRPFAQPRELPTVRIFRYDRYGRLIERGRR